MTQRADPVGPPRSTGSVRQPIAAPALAGAMATATTRRERHITLRQDLTGWAFALPFVIIFVVFLAGPILASLALSFTDFGLRDLRNPLGTNFVGLENYIELAGDPTFCIALFNTVYFVVVGVPLTLGLGLGRGTRPRPRDQAVPDRVPGRLLPAGGHEHRRRSRSCGGSCSTRTSA